MGSEIKPRSAKDGVADGTRTHDDQNHNLGLYQLSYSHRQADIIALAGSVFRRVWRR